MHPELFEIPFLHISVKSYGTLMVVGFLAAVFLMRRMMRRSGQNPDFISNIAMYALLSGVLGARLFYVLHYFESFSGSLLDMLAVWRGGLELLGGVIAAIAFLWLYLWKQNLPKRLYLDVLAVGLMVGIGFGRLGCLMNSCCHGKCTDVPWAIQFPYGSLAYESQVYPDPDRNRHEPLLKLPADFFQDGFLKPLEELTPAQQQAVKEGKYNALNVHPTQIYSSLNAFILAGVLYAVWRRVGQKKLGVVTSLMFMLYGATRFFIETLRDDNPFEKAWWIIYKGGTVSQNIGIYMFIVGVVMLTIFATRKPEST